MSATIILDSINPEGIRLVTMQLRYWRGIHSELMTHRVFSRNARSSRAVPIKKMIEEVEREPFIPCHWGTNQKGMQADDECDEPVNVFSPISMMSLDLTREEAWLEARDRAVQVAQGFANAGYHKQLVNRLLEPFMWIDTLVTATEWSNFFALRDHPAAEPHFQDLAREMRTAMAGSEPQKAYPGMWHLPYIDWDSDPQMVAQFLASDEGPMWDQKIQGFRHLYTGDTTKAILIMISVARCARISYTPFDGKADVKSELERYRLLVGSHPMHASPAEHQATPDYMKGDIWAYREQHGNFRGWRQFRKMLPGECQ